MKGVRAAVKGVLVSTSGSQPLTSLGRDWNGIQKERGREKVGGTHG